MLFFSVSLNIEIEQLNLLCEQLNLFSNQRVDELFPELNKFYFYRSFYFIICDATSFWVCQQSFLDLRSPTVFDLICQCHNFLDSNLELNSDLSRIFHFPFLFPFTYSNWANSLPFSQFSGIPVLSFCNIPHTKVFCSYIIFVRATRIQKLFKYTV